MLPDTPPRELSGCGSWVQDYVDVIWHHIIICMHIHVQVKVPGFQARSGHRAAAFSIAPALTLVSIFGGGTSSSSNCAKMTMLEFGT